MTFSPRFSPDGQQGRHVAVAKARRPISTRWICARARTTRLTDTSAIDTSPCYSPDGSQIVFESDRGGTQQIYVMARVAAAREAHLLRRRTLFDAGLVAQGRSTSPSPGRTAGSFAIGVMKPDGIGRAHPHRRLPQRGPDLGAQRAVPDVLPRSGRRRRLEDLHDRRFRPRRVPGADAGLRLRSRLGRRCSTERDDPGRKSLQISRLSIFLSIDRINPNAIGSALVWRRGLMPPGGPHHWPGRRQAARRRYGRHLGFRRSGRFAGGQLQLHLLAVLLQRHRPEVGGAHHPAMIVLADAEADHGLDLSD